MQVYYLFLQTQFNKPRRTLSTQIKC